MHQQRNGSHCDMANRKTARRRLPRVHHTTVPTLLVEIEEGIWIATNLPKSAKKYELDQGVWQLESATWTLERINHRDTVLSMNEEIHEQRIIDDLMALLKETAFANNINFEATTKLQKLASYHSRLWVMPAGTQIELRSHGGDNLWSMREAVFYWSSLPSEMWEFAVVGEEFHILLMPDVKLTQTNPNEFSKTIKTTQLRGCSFKLGDWWYEAHAPVYNEARETWDTSKVQCFVFSAKARVASHSVVVKRSLLSNAEFKIDRDDEAFAAFSDKIRWEFIYSLHRENFDRQIFLGHQIHRVALESFCDKTKLEVAQRENLMRELVMEEENESKAAAKKKAIKREKKKTKRKKRQGRASTEDVEYPEKVDAVETVVTPLVARAHGLGIDTKMCQIVDEPKEVGGDEPKKGGGDEPNCIDDKAPDEYLCPITLELMKDPVLAADGFTYERASIEQWLRTGSCSPKTGEELPNRELIPNRILKILIDDLVK